MERFSGMGGTFPQACFTCPARIYVGGEYRCDPAKFDDKLIALNVARYRPSVCPKSINETNYRLSPEILLRKILNK